MKYQRSLWLLFSLVLAVRAGAGDRLGAQEQTPATKRGLIVIVGGVGGIENLKLSLQWALHHAGMEAEVQNFEWTHGKGHIFKDLQDTRNHIQKTKELVEEIHKVKNADPERPIYLIGRSAGTVVALAAAAELPPQTLERIILLSPAVSANFDLGPALRATRHEIVSFSSDLDWLVLGWGTQRFGTADRYYASSAGLGGFTPPPDADADTQELYHRLVQVRWTPSMILHGHTGGHIGTTLPTFLASDVVPWLKP